MAKSKPNREALDRLAAAEERFLASEFLAPALAGGKVQVRIAGVICQLKIAPTDFEGWGVFRPRTYTEAALVRPARLSERQRYLELFPLVRLILAWQADEHWLGLPAHRADGRLRIDGMVPVRLVEEPERFAVIQTRFDGAQFWYAGPEPRWDPATAAYLRQALEALVKPDQLDRPGLSAEEREAYRANYDIRYETSEEARRSREEQRLRQTLAAAGAEFKDCRERGDVFTVTYEVDGQRHVSAVARTDLSVQVAGICLSGQDENFDLQSLVGVIREAQGSGEIVRVGPPNQGMAEEQYWQVHPRRRR
jgi:hypothetical protein